MDQLYRKNKVPEIALLFWITKICATTLGETGGDWVSMTLNVGYAISSLIFISFFAITVTGQLLTRKYIPALYWSVIVATSTAGTTISDYMDRTLELGYVMGSAILMSCLLVVLGIWRYSEKSLSVKDIKTFRGEIFYWTAILFSNTLGTALGDFLADSSGLGFEGSAILISSVLLLVVLAHYFTKISSVVLFWIAFVLTRPFGATFGDLLTKPHEKGGLEYGTQGASLILFILLVLLVVYDTIRIKKLHFHSDDGAR